MPKYIKPSDGIVVIESTKALRVPAGTITERPSEPSAGQLRYNTTTNQMEFYNGTSWTQLAAGGSSGNFVQKSGDTMTGQLQVIRGSNTVPGLSFDGDSDTGIFLPIDGNISFTFDSQELVKFNSTSVDIGNLSLSSYVNMNLFGKLNIKTNQVDILTLENSATSLDIKIKQNNTEYWTIRNEITTLSIVKDGASSAKFVEFDRINNTVKIQDGSLGIRTNIPFSESLFVSGDSRFNGVVQIRYSNGLNFYNLPSSAGNIGQVLTSNGPNNTLSWTTINVSSGGGGSSISLSAGGDIEIILSSPNEYRISANTGIITASNAGAGISIIASAGKDLSLKNLNAAGGIELIDNGTDIIISAANVKPVVGSGDVEVSTSPTQIVVSANTGIITASNAGTGIALIDSVGKNLSLRSLQGSGIVDISVVGQTILISAASGSGIVELSTQVFTSAGTTTITVPTGFKSCEVIVVGGGGAGGAVRDNGTFPARGAGGGAGAFCNAYISGFTPGSNLTITVGSAGITSPFASKAEKGGNSIFGNFIICSGGAGGNNVGNTFINIGNRDEPAGFVVNSPVGSVVVKWFHAVSGEPGFPEHGEFYTSANSTANFDKTVYYHGGSVPLFGKGGKFAVGGVDVSGNNATGYGAGGGGALRMLGNNNRSGGKGTPGIIIIKWIKK